MTGLTNKRLGTFMAEVRSDLNQRVVAEGCVEWRPGDAADATVNRWIIENREVVGESVRRVMNEWMSKSI